MSDDRRDTVYTINRRRLDALAEHFDATDAGDLPWDEATDVELEQISIRLSKDDIALLKAEAARAGIGYTTLVRMVVRRHLRRVRAS